MRVFRVCAAGFSDSPASRPQFQILAEALVLVKPANHSGSLFDCALAPIFCTAVQRRQDLVYHARVSQTRRELCPRQVILPGDIQTMPRCPDDLNFGLRLGLAAHKLAPLAGNGHGRAHCRNFDGRPGVGSGRHGPVARKNAVAQFHHTRAGQRIHLGIPIGDNQ